MYATANQGVSKLVISGLSCVLACIVVIGSLLPDDAGAIPAFARRYKISCTTCHAPFPRLKPYGEEFAGNGFVIPEDEKKRDYVTGGDDLLWLNRTFPVAVRFDAYGVYESEKTVDKDLQIPWGLKLLSGGAVYKSVGYYFYFYMSERGEVAGIEDAYIHFNDIGGSALDIMLGQFQTSDPLLKRELRLTYEDYVAYTVRVGTSRINLAYDRGLMLTYGIAATKTDLAAFVVNGNGRVTANEDTRNFDQDKNKSVGFRVLQGIGDAVGVGAFVYYGEEILLEDTAGAGGVAGAENRVTYVGPDVHLGWGPLAFSGQYLYREDTNPLFASPASKTVTDGWILELTYAPAEDRARHYITVLYNLVDSDLWFNDYEALTFSATYVLARNLRLTAEYSRLFTDTAFTGEEPSQVKNANRVVLGLVSAF
jgi:hypothetical protein